MKEIALAHNVPVFQPESINTPEGIAQLREWQADLLVVAAYGQILSRDVLAVPPHGGINVHASLLPKYRGAAPIAWAIYHGETQTGVTIIRMSAGLDAGDMLAQEAIDIGLDETAGEVEARLAPIGARLAMQCDRADSGGRDAGPEARRRPRHQGAEADEGDRAPSTGKATGPRRGATRFGRCSRGRRRTPSGIASARNRCG